MPVDPIKKHSRSRLRINLTEEYELAFMMGSFDLNEDELTEEDELLEAIRLVGNSPREVENYLRARNACSRSKR